MDGPLTTLPCTRDHSSTVPIMLVSTLLSALPLLQPALPAQEPVHNTRPTWSQTERNSAAQSQTQRGKSGNTVKQRAQKRWRKIQNRYVQSGATATPTTSTGTWNFTTQTAQQPTRVRTGRTVTNNVHPGQARTDVSALATVDTSCCKSSTKSKASKRQIVVGGENTQPSVDRLAFVTTTNTRPGVAMSSNGNTDACDVSALATIATPGNTSQGNWSTPVNSIPQTWSVQDVNPAHVRAFGVGGLTRIDTAPRTVRTTTGTFRTETTKSNNSIRFKKSRRAQQR